MKKILVLILVASLSISLTACSREISVEEENQDEVVLEETVVEETFVRTDGVVYDHQSTVNNEYIFANLHPSEGFKYGIPILHRVLSDGTVMPFCQLEGCDHTGVACDGYTENTEQVVFYYNDKYYTLVSRENNAGGMAIFEFTSESYKAKKEVFVFENGFSPITYGSNFSIYQNYLIVPAKKYENDTYYADILKINLDNFEYEVIYSKAVEENDLSIHDVVDGNVIFTTKLYPPLENSNQEIDYDNPPITKVYIHSLDLETNEAKRLIDSPNDNGRFEIEGDYIYTYEGDYASFKTNIHTGERELLFDLSSQGRAIGSFWDLEDGYLTYNTTSLPRGTYSNTLQQYALNLQTKETTTMDLMGHENGNFLTAMEIFGIYDDGNYIVAKDYINPEVKELAIISKEDYWNNNANFIDIGTYKMF